MTAPTLFDATCPTCGGSTEITLAFLKAKSGLMRCRQCQNIFDGFAEDSSLRPAVPFAQAPMAQLGVHVPALPPVVAQQYIHPAQVQSDTIFTPAAQVRAPRVIRFPNVSGAQGAPAGSASVDFVQSDAPVIQTMQVDRKSEVASSLTTRESVASFESSIPVTEPTPCIEVRKRGLVPNREISLGGQDTSSALLDIRLPDRSGEPLEAKSIVAENSENPVPHLGFIEILPSIFVESTAPIALAAPSLALVEASAQSSDPIGTLRVPDEVQEKIYEITQPQPQAVSEIFEAMPISGLMSKDLDQTVLEPLVEQLDLILAVVEVKDEAPSMLILDKISPPSALAPPRARAPRLAPLMSRDLPEEPGVNDHTVMASKSVLPIFTESGATAVHVDPTSVGIPLRTEDARPSATREPASFVESRKLEPRKIAPREIGRPPEVVGQHRESRSWAWGSSGAGPTALDRARARLAPPVAWIKKAAPARREILPNWSGWVILVACVAGLAIQVARIERNTIYSRAPWARSGLALMCQIAGCKAGLAMAKEQLELEAAQVRADSEGRLVFTASLKNKAPYESLAPRLWISIEGEDGKSMASRTFASSEWLGASSVKGSSEIDAKLVFAAPGKAAAGYKAELVLEAAR